jgi:alpha-beta hydrolase superfamily lysophospholipase/SAM-dependent methyltransferase
MQLTEHALTSWDGAELIYRVWMPEQMPKKAVLLFHRGHEHSGRWNQTVEALNLEDFAVFAWDQRGHGRSSGERGAAKNLAAIVKDADVFARHVCQTFGIAIENVVVLAHSVGAVIAAAWVHDYAPRIRAMILAAPAFRVKLYVPLAAPLLRLKQKCLGPGMVKSYVKAKMLTHDPAEARAYEEDGLIFRQIAVNILLDLHDTSTRLMADAAAITVPTLILAASNDWIVTIGAQRRFFRNLGSPIKQMEILRGFYHAIFHEKKRQIVIDRIRAFVLDSFSRPWQHDGLLESDHGGFTRTEYDLLRASGGARWPLVRSALKTGGRLSEGIRLGWRTGFDSGVTLDYVYENRARGFSPLGKCIDYFYLNSIGWRGIRVRRENLGRALRECMADLQRVGQPIRILDIASGPGRYVLETISEMKETAALVVLRDYQQVNLDAAKLLSEKLGLRDVAIAHGDAFDRESLAAIAPRPTIAIVSGLYELTVENDRVLRSLRGVADAMEQGGYLIYTNQPWHPQIEFIAKVLTNREGQPWIMRRRTQSEMDELVRSVGFEKIRQEIDSWGIFTVAVARRMAK